MEIDVSIVIVNYNTRNVVLQCLRSIYHYTKDLSFEIIVVDNASQDGSPEMIRNEFPNVFLIESQLNVGFGKANNIGARQASGRFLLLLNSDTILIENSIRKLKDYVEDATDPQIAVAGCNMLNANKNMAVSYGNFPSLTQEIFEYGLTKLFKKYYDSRLSIAVIDDSKTAKQVDYITGACMFFKKHIFREFGGFDEGFFLYYEETELCFRLKRAGYKIAWYPATSIIHLEGGSGNKPEGVNYWILEKYYDSKYLYYKKCHGNFVAILIKYLSVPKIIRIYKKYDSKRILKILLKAGEK